MAQTEVATLIKQLHETGKATKELMANTTVASGAVVGGPQTQSPPVSPSSK